MRVGKKHSCCETVSTLDRFYRCVSLACQLGSSEDIEVVEKARFVCFEDGHLVFTNLHLCCGSCLGCGYVVLIVLFQQLLTEDKGGLNKGQLAQTMSQTMSLQLIHFIDVKAT